MSPRDPRARRRWRWHRPRREPELVGISPDEEIGEGELGLLRLQFSEQRMQDAAMPQTQRPHLR